MNLILLFDDDFVDSDRVRLQGRRREHVVRVHRASVGDRLTVGRISKMHAPPISPLPAKARRGWREAPGEGRDSRTHSQEPPIRPQPTSIGTGTITHLGPEALEMRVTLDREPPPKLPLNLVLALPRPKVLNRVLAGATSLGVGRIWLINAWRVEKSYWKSPRMSEENLLEQRVLGLEQARDTVLPEIETRRFFRPFVEEELPGIAAGTLAIAGHPGATEVCPRDVDGAVTLVIGPEGGFIAEEVASLERIGVRPVSLGPRILRVETAVPALIGRLF